MDEIEIMMVGIFICICFTIILKYFFNWNVENPSLLILSYTQIGLFFSLGILNKRSKTKK